MRDLVERTIARRAMLQTTAVGAEPWCSGMPCHRVRRRSARRHGEDAAGRNLRFTPVAPNNRDSVTVPQGFGHHVVISWGDRVMPGAPRFNVHDQTPEAAALQFGYNCDYIGVLPLSRTRAFWSSTTSTPTRNSCSRPVSTTRTRSGGSPWPHTACPSSRSSATGNQGAWRGTDHQGPLQPPHHRRPRFAVTGPAADPRSGRPPTHRHARVLGTLNNCAGGMTPWGTVLTGEENFNQYFEASGATRRRGTADSYARYGITRGPDRAGRGRPSLRPDAGAPRAAPVRLDRGGRPVRPDSPRQAHDARSVQARGREHRCRQRPGAFVAYMGDDERGDYIYKFVSRDRMSLRDAAGAPAQPALLEKGTLYVARFTGDGAADGTDGTGGGSHSPATPSRSSMTCPSPRSSSTPARRRRGRADQDGPAEDVEPTRSTARCTALTNNIQRGSTYPTDEANPLATCMVRTSPDAPLTTQSGNRNGYVLEIAETRTTHRRRLRLEALPGLRRPGRPGDVLRRIRKEKVSPITAPTTSPSIPKATCGSPPMATPWGPTTACSGCRSRPRAWAREAVLDRACGAETCGPLITRDARAVFVAVQHPGETDGSTFESPTSTWPHTHDFPRPSVVVAYRP